MPKDTKTLGNNKARACESLGFVHKKRLCQRFDTTSFLSYKFEDYSVDFYFRVTGTFIINDHSIYYKPACRLCANLSLFFV